MRAQRFTVRICVLSLALATLATAALSPELDRALKESKYVYVQSERKAGDLGKSAEIWYFYDAGTVYVASPPTAWRVRRIKAGRRKARIAVGKPDGPSFAATGRTLHDGAIEERLLSEDQEALSARFAKSGGDKFTGVPYHLGRLGIPVLDGTLGHVECRIIETHEGGDHVIHVGAVEHAELHGGPPLIFFQGKYHRLKFH